MIHHIIRMKLRDDVGQEQLEGALEALADGGRDIPSVKFFAYGREFGGRFDWTAIFGFGDLDGYREYLTHPLHKRMERLAFPLVAGFETFDFSLSAEPDLESRIVECSGPTSGPTPSSSSSSPAWSSTPGPPRCRSDVRKVLGGGPRVNLGDDSEASAADS